MAEDIVIKISGNISAGVAKSIRNIGEAALQADTNLDVLRNSLKSLSAVGALRQATQDTREFRNEVNRATQTQKTFSAATKDTAQTLLEGARAADKYGASLNKLDGANVKLSRTSSALSGIVGNLVGLFGGIFAVTQYAQAQDALTGMQNKIRSLTADTAKQAQIQQALFEVSNRTRSSVVATTDGFVRFSKAMRDASSSEVLRFVETLNKSLVTAGRTSGEVSSIVIQLGQALTSGRLMGDEFRSLSENLPYEALQAIAGVLGVNVDKLKELSTEGKITTDVLRKAFANMAGGIDEAFARTVPTIGQAITVLNNQFIAFTASSSSGANLVAGAIMLIGQNLGVIIPAVAAFAAVWLSVKAYTIVTELVVILTTGLIPALARAALATVAFLGPWGLLATAVLATVAAIAYFSGNLDGFISKVGEAVGSLAEMASKSLGVDAESLKAAASVGELSNATGSATSSMNAFTTETQDGTSALKAFESAGTKAANNVAASFRRLSVAANAAADASYKALQAVGGTKGSFTAAPSISNPSTYSSDTFSRQKADGSFAQGGSAMVRGRAGVDNNLVKVRLSKGERMDVLTPAQQRTQRSGGGGGGTVQYVNVNVNTPNADSFNRSRQQVSRATAAAMAVGF